MVLLGVDSPGWRVLLSAFFFRSFYLVDGFLWLPLMLFCCLGIDGIIGFEVGAVLLFSFRLPWFLVLRVSLRLAVRAFVVFWFFISCLWFHCG